MAKIIVEIPDGEFCSSEKYLDCAFAQHCRDEHFCHLYRHYLGDSEYLKINGEERKVFRKCKPCSKHS